MSTCIKYEWDLLEFCRWMKIQAYYNFTLLYTNTYFYIQIAHECTKFVDVMNINIVNISEDIKTGTNNKRGNSSWKIRIPVLYPLHNLYAKPTTVYFYLPLEWSPAFKRDYNGAL